MANTAMAVVGLERSDEQRDRACSHGSWDGSRCWTHMAWVSAGECTQIVPDTERLQTAIRDASTAPQPQPHSSHHRGPVRDTRPLYLKRQAKDGSSTTHGTGTGVLGANNDDAD